MDTISRACNLSGPLVILNGAAVNGDRVVSPRVVKTRFIARHPGEINPSH